VNKWHDYKFRSYRLVYHYIFNHILLYQPQRAYRHRLNAKIYGIAQLCPTDQTW